MLGFDEVLFWEFSEVIFLWKKPEGPVKRVFLMKGLP